jgi:DNA polymerase V
MFILSRCTPRLDIYSIDEAFLDLSDMGSAEEMKSYGERISHEIKNSVGIPVSIGIAPTKTLAKIGSKYAKKYAGYKGCCLIDTDERRQKALSMFEIGDVWGIGRKLTKRLNNEGIITAADFAAKSERWVKSRFNVTTLRTWKELNGTPAITIAGKEHQKSIMYSRTFAHMTGSKAVLLRELSNYASSASRRLREQESVCQTVTLFLTTNRHREDLPQYQADETIKLTTATDDSTLIIDCVSRLLDRLFRENYMYKQAGVILGGLLSNKSVQLDLFTPDHANEKQRRNRLMKTIDGINKRYGANRIHFAVQGVEADTSEQPAGFMRAHKIDETDD